MELKNWLPFQFVYECTSTYTIVNIRVNVLITYYINYNPPSIPDPRKVVSVDMDYLHTRFCKFVNYRIDNVRLAIIAISIEATSVIGYHHRNAPPTPE